MGFTVCLLGRISTMPMKMVMLLREILLLGAENNLVQLKFVMGLHKRAHVCRINICHDIE